MYLITAGTAVIDVLRGHQPAITWFTTLTEVPSVPGFVIMELIQNKIPIYHL